MKTTTITIQIGNSDDKLSQKEWAYFIRNMDMYIRAYSDVHFCAPSHGDAEWQNFCWVCVVRHEDDLPVLKRLVKDIANAYKQDSVAWTEGTTKLI